ncbi:MAG TPA: ABC transporter substrate-binding protein [Gaiellaceae bacterium]|nr:ABC transporter substrate-binding protein [Gaiellaceae bacterium]
MNSRPATLASPEVVVKRIALTAVLVTTLAAVGGAQPGIGARSATTINYATSFGNFGRDAYVYVAIERGYFQEAGFDVKVTPGTGSLDNIKLVAAGRLDYAPVDIGALVVAKANEGIPVKTVAVVHQNTLSAIFTLEESGITDPKQLEGKSFADSPASTVRVLLPIYAKKAGFDVSKVTIRDAAPPALPALLATKQVDAIGQFTVGKPLVQRAAGGKPIRAFKYAKVMPGMLGIGLVASEDKLRSNPGEVRAFTRALLRGLSWAVDNPGTAGYILQKYVPLADPIVAAQELRIMRQFVKNKLTRQKGYGTGYIDLGKLASTISIVRNGFKIAKPVPLTDLYSDVAVPAQKPKR